MEQENTMTSQSVISAGCTITFKIPLQIEWNPQEDITAFELALCLQYHGRSLQSWETVDERVIRHFKITDPNQK